jgi:hypothetical protein
MAYMPAANNYGPSYAITTARPPVPYGVLPSNNYGSSYYSPDPYGSSFGPSSVYGIGSRPTSTYYGGYQQQQQQQPYNNFAGQYHPPQPMNIAYHGTAW